MTILRSSLLLVTLAIVLAACSSDGAEPGAEGWRCEYKAPGTQLASCRDDSDCYSGFCDQSGNPGPYCFVPTRIARDEGHGYGCSTDADCNEVLDAATLAGGLSGECRNDSIYSGCLFACGAGGGGGGSGSGSGSGTGPGTP